MTGKIFPAKACRHFTWIITLLLHINSFDTGRNFFGCRFVVFVLSRRNIDFYPSSIYSTCKWFCLTDEANIPVWLSVRRIHLEEQWRFHLKCIDFGALLSQRLPSRSNWIGSLTSRTLFICLYMSQLSFLLAKVNPEWKMPFTTMTLWRYNDVISSVFFFSKIKVQYRMYIWLLLCCLLKQQYSLESRIQKLWLCRVLSSSW